MSRKPELSHAPPQRNEIETTEEKRRQVLDDFTATVMQLSPQNYLASMLYGGVFDRHPGLRIGVIELGAMWVGPFVDLLEDRMALSRRLREALQRRPTEVFIDQIA